MKIFLVGIGGIAMGNLAYMLQSMGHEVSGSDENIYPPMSTKLDEWGMNPKIGYRAENVKGSDLVIIGNAISRGNPEVEEVLNSGMEYMSMPQAIGHFILKKKKVIVVAGTHGKTTTTFLIHHLLKEAGFSPGLFVGGIRKDGFPGFEIGTGEYFVIEGDEYDSSFFDKSSKFLHYKPHYLILTSLDFDHADIFSDLSAIKTMFKRLLNLVPSKGKVFYWSGSKNLKEICKDYKNSPIAAYAPGNSSSLLSVSKGKIRSKKFIGEIKTNLLGNHNLTNTEAALQVCNQIDPAKFSDFISALGTFSGVKRRQDILFTSENSVLIEDFAHHPVAIQETIHAVRAAYPDFKLISLFEPRSATSHRNIFQKEFSGCFKGSHIAMITEIYNLKKVAKNVRLNVRKVVSDIPRNSKCKGIYQKDPKALVSSLAKTLQSFSGKKVAILAMSNGSFGGVYEDLIKVLKTREK